MPRSKESYSQPRNSNWPKTSKITVRLADELLLKKPENVTLTEWIRKALEQWKL